MGYYIKVIKMGEIVRDVYSGRDEDGVRDFSRIPIITDEGIKTNLTIKELPFTPDGLGCLPSIHNVFDTPREALDAFNKLLERHTEWDYVDIEMAEWTYCSI